MQPAAGCLGFLLLLLLLTAGAAHAAGEAVAGLEEGKSEHPVVQDDPEEHVQEEWKKWLEPFRFSGWLEGMQGMRIREPNDAITSRARLHLETEVNFKHAYGFVSVDVEKNRQIDSESGFDLHELWLEHVGSGWDVRLGRQIIIWGKADGVQITDVISPPDYTEAMTRELDEIRMPVDAAKIRFFGKELVNRDINLELIAIPFFKKARLPKDGNPWYVESSLPPGLDMHVEDEDKPVTSLKNMEAAMKISGYYSGLDIAASLFYTWDDFPVYSREMSVENGTPVLTLSPEFRRMTVVGLEFSRPRGDFVFRGEAAWYLGRWRNTVSPATGPVKKDSLKWLLGADWTPGDDWNVSAQVMNESIFDYDRTLSDDREDSTVTLNVSKKLMNQTLTLSNMTYLDLNYGDVYNRSKAEYEIRDGLRISLGLDLFLGDEEGPYGMYQDNTQVWCKLRYSF